VPPHYEMDKREFLDEQLPGSWVRCRPVIVWLCLLGFCQRLCLHTTIATVLSRAMRLNLGFDCPSQCSSIYSAVGRNLSITHLLHKWWCASLFSACKL
jgi:hypothetical protein